ncbi:sepiapterin reductase-like isoform X2 [Haliotis rubra]|uniref:sepiapterin reductase-like isoform X2 n=1 Tax=Haliotis rubra TaxID=36100 RepID=UPI001EE59501|nr:sepiapterin reductase-like isoform X2 [Haliotis rubra]
MINHVQRETTSLTPLHVNLATMADLTGKGLFSTKTVCIVAGASRGIGRSIAVNFASKFPPGSLVIALSRDVEQLTVTKTLSTKASPAVLSVTHVFDQGTLDQHKYETLFKDSLQGRSTSEFQQAMIIHNAGSVGSEFCRNLTDVNQVSHYLNVNVAGLVALNAQFMQVFKDVPSKVVVNMSSLSAVQPMASWGLYCSGKAFRDMFMRTLALEQPDIRVLNYAPGPVDTNMFHKEGIQETKAEDHLEALREYKRKGSCASRGPSHYVSCQQLLGKPF